ncbi:hypothetical protein Tco_1300732 [Tanacetum coccineum]
MLRVCGRFGEYGDDGDVVFVVEKICIAKCLIVDCYIEAEIEWVPCGLRVKWEVKDVKHLEVDVESSLK